METIKNDTIELILSNKFDENFWLFELGRADAAVSNEITTEHQFMHSFWEKGERLWNTNLSFLKGILCDVDTKEPKESVEKIISGDTKEIITTIITGLTTTYNVTLSVAIPLCAIALKKGIRSLCKS